MTGLTAMAVTTIAHRRKVLGMNVPYSVMTMNHSSDPALTYRPTNAFRVAAGSPAACSR